MSESNRSAASQMPRATVTLHPVNIWSWGRDSNPHCTVSKTGASYQLGYLRINIGRSISPHIELELFYNVCSILFIFTFPGASDGNRTRIVCLEGRSVSHYTTPAYYLEVSTGLEPVIGRLQRRALSNLASLPYSIQTLNHNISWHRGWSLPIQEKPT